MLLQKAKVITTPTAYSDGILHSVKPIEGDADFTFTRNSSATRVGEDGYIQDVQIIGGELVQNGDFEQIGSELVTNGSFDTDSDWVKSGWVIENGQASNSLSGAGHNLYQNNVTSVGKIFKVVIKTTISAGSVKVMLGGGTGGYNVIGEATTSGTFTYYGISNGVDNRLLLQTGVGTTIGSVSIDNVSVKEVGQNWEFGTGWSIADIGGNQVAQFDGGADSAIQQISLLTNGVKYRLSLDVGNRTTGSLQIRFGNTGVVDETITTNGTFTYDLVSDGTTLYLRSISGFDGYIDNISVKEVTDDTNLPRINYEGFSYENGLPIYGSGKGHFLLEGQSTNLITYSEDFGEWTKIGSPTITNNYGISPEGVQNSTRFEAISDRITNDVVTINANETFSIYMRGSGALHIQLGGLDNFYPSLTNEWVRYEFKTTQAGFNASVQIRGTGSAVDVELYGAQYERNDYATSYIPTNGSVVTRAAETCNNAGNADLFDSEGVLYAEIAELADDSVDKVMTISDGTLNNRIAIAYTPTTNNIRGYLKGSSAITLDYIVSSTLDFNKVAVRYKLNEASLWINGVQVGTSTSAFSVSGLNELAFDRGDGNLPLYSKSKMVGVFPYLSNDEMECLTGEGYGSFQAMALANNYTVI
jgi:hypothetical protein